LKGAFEDCEDFSEKRAASTAVEWHVVLAAAARPFAEASIVAYVDLCLRVKALRTRSPPTVGVPDWQAHFSAATLAANRSVSMGDRRFPLAIDPRAVRKLAATIMDPSYELPTTQCFACGEDATPLTHKTCEAPALVQKPTKPAQVELCCPFLIHLCLLSSADQDFAVSGCHHAPSGERIEGVVY
jgi:hypothetical protein